MKTDHLFYRLFQALPTLALELAGIETPGAERYAFHAEEVKQTAFRLDGLLLPPAELREAPVVFVEVQYQPDEEFYGRLFAEMFLYLYRATPRRCWRAVVVYPERAVERRDERYDSLLTVPEIHRVYLEDWRERPAPTVGLQLLQSVLVAPAAVDRRAVALARRAREMGAASTLPTAVWLDLIETILVYRLPQLRGCQKTNLLIVGAALAAI
ncbi:MAG: Rpn family recombination-promoting nuclease/putative transposase [Candidatus Competibacter sp.]|nr:Rpn family recombination-promoting nuclease/putative transposase [Candidatus Competibacter sp.]